MNSIRWLISLTSDFEYPQHFDLMNAFLKGFLEEVYMDNILIHLISHFSQLIEKHAKLTKALMGLSNPLELVWLVL